MSKFKNAVKKLPIVPTAYRTVRDKLLANKEAVMTPLGFKFIGSTAMQSGAFEPEDVKVFQALIKNVDTVVDAGAHAGYYCMQALQAGKHVIAFEPMPLNMAMLLKNITANGWERNAEVFQLALAEHPGIAKMYGGGTGASLIQGWAGFSKKNPILVPLSSMDKVLNTRLAGSKVLVLIDVEGAEYELLKGAKTLLASEPKPTWMIEIALSGNQPEGRTTNPNFIPTFELFWHHGYDAYACIGKEIKLLDEKELHSDSEKATKGISSNFIFVHKTSIEARKALENLSID